MAESSIKLLIDEQLWEDLAARLCAKGFDAIHVNHIGYRSTDDEVIFALAAKQGRAILTNNHRDFAPLVFQWYTDNRQHAGVIFTTQLTRGELLRQTLNLLTSLTANQLKNSIRWLQEFR